MPLNISGTLETVVTDTNGYYIFTDIPPGEYIIEPMDTTYNFAPAFYEVTIEDSDFENMSFLTTPANPSGIEANLSYDIKVECFPNPATDFITLNSASIENGETITVELFTIKGGKVYNENTRSTRNGFNYKIDLTNISTGIYFVKLSYKNQKITKKIIVN